MKIIKNLNIILLLFFINSIKAKNTNSELKNDDNCEVSSDPEAINEECDKNMNKAYNLFETLKEVDNKTLVIIMENMESLEKHIRQIIEQIVNERLYDKIEELRERKIIKFYDEYDTNADKHEMNCPDNNFLEICQDQNDCTNKLYNITIPSISSKPQTVVCDLKTLGGGWTIIQRRLDGTENFNRNWTDYLKGFGNLNGEFFMGLKKLHALTSTGEPQELYIMLEDYEGIKSYARYGEFRIDNQRSKYKLIIGEYSGDAGDSLTQHNGCKFSTYDRDNDGTLANCAKYHKGGWWYTRCYNSNLNGGYVKDATNGGGVIWSTFRDIHYSLKFSQMMIRPKKV